MVDELLTNGYEVGDWIMDYDPAVSYPWKKLKFEQGDWVVAIDNDRMGKFKGRMHPSWVWEAYNQVGDVIGKYSGSAGLHFAIRYPLLKKVYPVHMFFLRRATMGEYEDTMKGIEFNKLKQKYPELEGIF